MNQFEPPARVLARRVDSETPSPAGRTGFDDGMLLTEKGKFSGRRERNGVLPDGDARGNWHSSCIIARAHRGVEKVPSNHSQEYP